MNVCNAIQIKYITDLKEKLSKREASDLFVIEPTRNKYNTAGGNFAVS